MSQATWHDMIINDNLSIIFEFTFNNAINQIIHWEIPKGIMRLFK